jgi:hypothetical protein
VPGKEQKDQFRTAVGKRGASAERILKSRPQDSCEERKKQAPRASPDHGKKGERHACERFALILWCFANVQKN